MRQAAASLAVVVLAALAVAAACPARADSDNLIVPGERVGDLRLGASLPDLLKIKGEPIFSDTQAYRDKTFYHYPAMGVLASNTIEAIMVSSPDYKTKEGVMVGMSELQMNVLLGRPRCRTPDSPWYTYDKMKILIISSHVSEIDVGRNFEC